MDSNLIFTWLRDPRFASEPVEELEAADACCFVSVEIGGQFHDLSAPSTDDAGPTDGRIEIDIGAIISEFGIDAGRPVGLF